MSQSAVARIGSIAARVAAPAVAALLTLAFAPAPAAAQWLGQPRFGQTPAGFAGPGIAGPGFGPSGFPMRGFDLPLRTERLSYDPYLSPFGGGQPGYPQPLYGYPAPSAFAQPSLGGWAGVQPPTRFGPPAQFGLPPGYRSPFPPSPWGGAPGAAGFHGVAGSGAVFPTAPADTAAAAPPEAATIRPLDQAHILRPDPYGPAVKVEPRAKEVIVDGIRARRYDYSFE
ncbi:MAG: hypothetical protein AAF907_14180, partial [Planctomycetota bacterium]